MIGSSGTSIIIIIIVIIIIIIIIIILLSWSQIVRNTLRFLSIVLFLLYTFFEFLFSIYFF